MHSAFPFETLPPPLAIALPAVDLDSVEATHFVRALAQRAQPMPPQLVVDCRQLKCLRTQGVSYVVSQLLVLHQNGARVFLRNAEPVLQRCLRLLRLDTLFSIA